MPLQDVKVIIDIKKPSSLIGLGTPLILASKTGSNESTYKEYYDLDSLKADFPDTTDAYKLAKSIIGQGDYRPNKVAVATYNEKATTPIKAKDALEKYFYNDWYFVLLDVGEVADKIAISDLVEEKAIKMVAHKVADTTERDALKAKKYDRTIVFQHSVNAELPHAGLIGAVGSKPVGSVTWKFKNIKGITPQDLSVTEVMAAHKNGAITYVTKAGIPQTSEGIVVSGEYIDVIHGKDWIKLNLEQQIQYLLSTNDKIPYTNQGIAQIEAVVTTVLETATRFGIVATGDDGKGQYWIKAQRRDEVLPSDRAERKYNGLSFGFDLAGAIHEATVKGEIVI